MADRSGYIGRAPGDSSVTVARQTFSPTGITTDFTFASGYTPGYFDIFINGAKMIEGSDYTSTDGSTFVILNGGAISGDVIEGVAYKAFNAATATIGISSAGTPISTQANTLNFVGTGNTFALRGTTIDVSISGGAGAGGTWSNYDSNAGVTTTKKVKIQNNLEVTGVTTSTGGFVGALTGNVTGNVTGTVSGNAGSATVLASSRNIGGVAFNGSGDINLPGVNASGTQNTSGTAAGLSGTPDITVRNITGVAATFTGVLTYEDVTNIDSVGIVTARTGIKVLAGGINAVGLVTGTAFTGYDYLRAPFSTTVSFTVTVAAKTSAHRYNGTGSSNAFLIDGVQSPFLTLTPGRTYRFVHDNTGSHPLKFYLEADKTTLYSTGVTFNNAYTEIVVTDSTPQVLHYQCTNHAYMGNAVNTNSNVAATQPAAGIATEAATPNNAVLTLNLTTAQDHKVTASGITTITCSGGTEADSHTVRIINSGTATVGFSTFFLFPSGSTPSLPTADGAISLISFTVNRVGAAGTQLLAGASVNFS